MAYGAARINSGIARKRRRFPTGLRAGARTRARQASPACPRSGAHSLAPVRVATALIVLFSANGLISTGVFGTDFGIYGLKGLTIGLVLAFFPAPYINMLGMLRSLDPSLEEAASNLGATRWTVFRKITAPR